VRRARLAELGQPEVENFNHPVGPHHYVLGFDIAMGYAGGVRGGEGACDLNRDIADIEGRQSPGTHAAAQRLPLDKLSRDEVNRLNLANFENGDQVWMVEGRCCSRLLLGAPRSEE